MMGQRDDIILKAFTGIEGGVVGAGSTCGIISGGAMGLALLHFDDILDVGLPAQIGLLSLVGDYVEWHKNTHGASLCRERTGVEFHKTKGLLRYLIPGDKFIKCLWRIRSAVRQLNILMHKELPIVPMEDDETHKEPFHCAQAVLRGIKENTDIGDGPLEHLSLVFDGGLGLQGGICGALAGAIMGLNLLLGWNVREMTYFQIMKAFLVGHMNLLKSEPVDMPEPFGVGKVIVNTFKDASGAMECESIVGRKFSDWFDFQEYVVNSEKCAGLIDLAISEASKAIETYKPMVKEDGDR